MNFPESAARYSQKTEVSRILHTEWDKSGWFLVSMLTNLIDRLLSRILVHANGSSRGQEPRLQRIQLYRSSFARSVQELLCVTLVPPWCVLIWCSVCMHCSPRFCLTPAVFPVYLPSDFVVVGSDSGRIVILEYKPSKNAFEKVSDCGSRHV